ncbi:leucyl aminopeptidase family protein [Salana multivorans]
MSDLAQPPFPTVEVLPLEGATGAEWDAVAVPIAPGGEDGIEPRTGVADVATWYGVDLADLADLAGATGKAGEITTVPLPRLLSGSAQWNELPRRIVLVGVGDGSTSALRTAGAQLARAASSWGRVLTTVPLIRLANGRTARAGTTGDDDADDAAFVVGALLASHTAYSRKTGTPKPTLQRLGLATLPGTSATGIKHLRAAAERGRVLAAGTAIARTLAATPADIATPAWIADRARKLVDAVVAEQAAESGTSAGSSRSAALDLTIEVHDEAWLTENGFGGILAVSSGSVNTPRLVVVSYDGRRGTRRSPDGPTIAVVGKGITYDTGGLALKPREGMATMKTDMTGSAVALATVVTAARLGLPVRVAGVMCLAENAFSGSSYRPGDVVRVWDGTSVEIGNTDAEGRMVLADGLAWTAQTWQPDVLLDVATLTGAAGLALGRGMGALFTPDSDLAGALERAGAEAGEQLWRLPLVVDYRASLASEVADVSHIATDPHVKAGAVTAALFLERFAHGREWAHLDIAGPARAAKARHEIQEGATGFGVRLLTRWLSSLT